MLVRMLIYCPRAYVDYIQHFAFLLHADFREGGAWEGTSWRMRSGNECRLWVLQEGLR